MRGQLSRRAWLKLGAAGLAVAACAPAAQAPTGPSSVTPKSGGTITVIGGGTGFTSANGYDPHQQGASRTTSLLFDTLVEAKVDGTIQPMLAESWSASSDGLTWTFKLRKGVKWHNGRDLAADDIKYSFERILDPKTNHPQRSRYTVIKSIATPDTGTVAFTLTRAYAPFGAIVADVGASIVPKEEVAKGKFLERPVGTGPFKFVEARLDEYVDVAKNADYWMPGLPRLDRMRLLQRGDAQAEVLRLRSRQADMYLDAPAESYSQLSTDPQFDSYGAKDLLTYAWLGLNETKVSQFKDVRVRQAIYWALDRDAIVRSALPGLATPMRGSIFPASHWAALKEPVFPKQDLDKARALLRDAGLPNGFKFELQTYNAITHFPLAVQIVQQQLKQIGLDVTLNVLGTGPTAAQRPDLPAYLWGFPGQIDPDLELSLSYIKGQGQNYFGWEDPQLTALIDKGRAVVDQAERAKVYADAQRLAALSGWYTAIYQYNKYDVAYKHVRGYTYNPVSPHMWRACRDIWLDK